MSCYRLSVAYDGLPTDARDREIEQRIGGSIIGSGNLLNPPVRDLEFEFESRADAKRGHAAAVEMCDEGRLSSVTDLQEEKWTH